MTEGEREIIECRPTKWFYLRAIAMVSMFAIFLVLFLKDWKVGWPKKNEVYYTFQAFAEAKKAFRAHEESGGGAESWKSFASAQRIAFPEEEGVLPERVDRQATWPAILADYEGYKTALEEEGNKAIPPLWASYTDERGWSSGTPAKSYSQSKIKEQLYIGIGSGVLMLIGLFFLIRTSRRSMKVDGEFYYAPNGQRIRFSEIWRIDKRKWETKGLAYLSHGERGGGSRTKVDGMVYGQFKSAEGAPAERLFERILVNFEGELVELESDETEDDGETPGDGADPETAESGEKEVQKESPE